MGESNKYDFLPDPAAAFSGAEEGMARRLDEDNVLEFREEEIREAAHKKLWTQVCPNFLPFIVYDNVGVILMSIKKESLVS